MARFQGSASRVVGSASGCCWRQCGGGLLAGHRRRGAEARGFSPGVGAWVAAGVLEAGDQNTGGLAGRGQFALGCGLLEELVGLVASGLRVGQEGGEGGPAGVGEDPVGVAWDGGAYVVGERATGLLLRLTLFEYDERGGEGLVGGFL